MSAPLDLAKELIAIPSITPEDCGCQSVIAERLSLHGFSCHSYPFEEVNNLYACHGSSSPRLLFAGHTDVVPPGPLDSWQFAPFSPTVYNQCLYGRGAADMKSSLAAMVVACEQFVNEYPHHKGSLALLLTSDEEGPAQNGTVKAMQALTEQGINFDYCVVGEPSSSKQLGDVIKIGRRGSLNGTLTVQGKQGHIAYPHLAVNPIHQAIQALQALIAETWDDGYEHFPKTSLQLSNINSGTGVTNVIPDTLQVTFNFRYSPAVTCDELITRTEKILTQHNIDFTIAWKLSGLPFITEKKSLITATQHAINKIKGYKPQLSTDGGTSDGRFIAPYGVEVIELGPINATIHQINEHISIDQLDELTQIYYEIIKQLLNT